MRGGGVHQFVRVVTKPRWPAICGAMKICIYGAGSVGGFLAARLAQSGCDVSVVARGAHLDAIKRDGLTLIEGDRRTTVKLRASAAPSELGQQDVVIVTAKATDPRGLAAALPPLLGADTPVVFAQNGIPWWYLHGLPARDRMPDLAMLDPGGALQRAVGFNRAIGCVIYVPVEVVEPGVIEVGRISGIRFILGELDGLASPRVNAIAQAIKAAGAGGEVTQDIRREIWEKLWRNVGQSLICALIGRPSSAIRRSVRLSAITRALVGEVLAIAAAHGHPLTVDLDRHLGASPAGREHKPSILQDFEAGRPMELDALCASVQELARCAGVATPHLDTITALLIERATQAGLYRP
jgi:2-dehydropantoate 2-reductase